MPEITHMLMWVMSGRAVPRSCRILQGFGVHTYRLVNDAGADPDFHRRDLWEAIEAGAYPEWELGLQVFTEEQAEAFTFDVLDATKIVPEELVPVVPVGRMVLNRTPVIDVDVSVDAAPALLCDALVLPTGADAATALFRDGRTLDLRRGIGAG